MKTVNASSINNTVANMRQHALATAIVQKKTPGTYTFEFGSGSLAIEAVVNFLLVGNSRREMQRNVDALSSVMLDHGKNKRIFEKLFPSMTQALTENTQILSIGDIQDVVTKTLGAKAINGIVATYTEILVEAFSATKFVARSDGYSFREIRVDRFPNADDLTREFLRSELISMLRSEPLRLNLTSNKFTPKLLQEEFQRVISRLGAAIAKVGYHYDYLHDAMYCVYTSLNDRGQLAEALPAEAAKSSELAELCSNVTFVLAAFETAHTAARGGQWGYRAAMSQTLQILNLSDRYDIVTLGTATGHYRYDSVADGRNNLIGGVLSYSAPIKHRVDAAMFHQQTAAISMAQATSLERHSESMNALITGLQGWDMLETAHRDVTTVVSTAQMSELSDTARSTLFTIGNISATEMMHLAVAKADAVYLPKNPKSKKGLGSLELIFHKDLGSKRLMADEVPFEGTVYTTSAETLLLCCESFSPELSLDLTGQFTPDFVWSTMIVDDLSDFTHDYNIEQNITVKVGDMDLELTLDMEQITRNIQRENAFMVSQPFTGTVVAEAMRAVMDARDWTLKQDFAAKNPAAKVRLDAQVSHLLYAMYQKVLSSEAIQNASEHVIRLLAKSVPPESRDLTYSTLEQSNYRIAIETQLVGFIMLALNVLPDDGNESVLKPINQIWKDTEFFNRMIGAARANR